MIGGVMAFGVIVYGGVKYTTSAGNPSGQSDAKEWIEAALLGLLLLVGAYFILNVINPQLINLTLPMLTPVNITAPVTGGAGGTTGGTTATGCAGTGVRTLPRMDLPGKPASQQPNGQARCSAAPEMIATLQCIESQPGIGSNDFTISEAMPPTVPHESTLPSGWLLCGHYAEQSHMRAGASARERRSRVRYDRRERICRMLGK